MEKPAVVVLRNCQTATHFLLPLFQEIATSFFIKGCGLAFFPYSLQHRKKQK